MSAVSILEDQDDRALDDAIARGMGPVPALWFDERRNRQKEKTAASAALKAKRTKAEAEAQALRLQKRTRDFVEGQLLWFKVIADVKPLQRDD